ncbi:MAG: adenylate/guanylate cyclase domain-containing protein, partial [Rhodobacteraceae bacterium]|nr:adenylate/guanylate cyclase domain-containing protein [Paracoccaceae bacterium]
MSILHITEKFAAQADETGDTRAEKNAIFLAAISCCLAGLVWSGMYYVVFGAVLTTVLPLVFVVVVGGALIWSHLTGKYRYAITAQIICIIYLPSIIQWYIGGLYDSGFVIVWASMGPLIALMFFTLRQSLIWLGLFLINIALTAAFNGHFAENGLIVPDTARQFFFVMNLSVPAIIIFAFSSYFIRSARRERQKADALLLNILPAKIAQRLKSQRGIVADEYDDVCVLFADIVEYTAYSHMMKPVDLVTELNEIFQMFDGLAQKHGLEKIKTIGDAYLVVGGLPEPLQDQDAAIADMALDMQAKISKIARSDGKPFSLRIGIHCGSVVAGVIGSSKIAYDLWGDTVNVASRLETGGAAGMIHVSEPFYQRLQSRFTFQKRDMI